MFNFPLSPSQTHPLQDSLPRSSDCPLHPLPENTGHLQRSMLEPACVSGMSVWQHGFWVPSSFLNVSLPFSLIPKLVTQDQTMLQLSNISTTCPTPGEHLRSHSLSLIEEETSEESPSRRVSWSSFTSLLSLGTLTLRERATTAINHPTGVLLGKDPGLLPTSISQLHRLLSSKSVLSRAPG